MANDRPVDIVLDSLEDGSPSSSPGRSDASAAVKSNDADGSAAPTTGPGRRIGGAWRLLLSVFVHLAEALIVLAILGEMVATVAEIVSRHFFESPLPWTDDLAGICLNLIAFLGGAVAIQRGRGLVLDVVIRKLPTTPSQIVQSFGITAALIYCARLLDTMPTFLKAAQVNKTPYLRLPTTVEAIWVPIGVGLLALFLIDMLIKFSWKAIFAGAAIAIALTAALYFIQQGNLDGTLAVPPTAILVVVFAACLLSGVPIALVIGIGAFSFIEVDGTISFDAVPVGLQSGIASFVLLAIPFFMLAGVLMDIGGLAERLINTIEPIVRRLRGGLLITQVVSVFLFSGISGSKTADIAAIGSATRKPLMNAGYRPEESAATLAAAAAMSETVPPSLAIIILASITSLSPASLFLAGILPAVAMTIVLSLGIVWRGRGGRYPAPGRLGIMEAIKAFPGALPALVLPIILIYGIVAGIGTSTEVSAVAVVYGLFVVTFGYRSLRVRDLWRAAVDASVLGGLTLFIISNATVLSQALTIDQIPQDITKQLARLGTKGAFLALTLVALVILGSVLEGLPAIIVFGPLLLPVATTLGVNPLQFGILLIVAMGIGSFAPPIGAGLYVASAMSGTTVDKVMRPAFFYTGVLLVGLAILALFPIITTVVPHWFGRS